MYLNPFFPLSFHFLPSVYHHRYQNTIWDLHSGFEVSRCLLRGRTEKDKNADEILEKLMKKPADKLEKSDLIPLLFSPLMDGPSGQNERILKSIRILRKAEQTILPEDIRKMEAILYILATKFLSGETLEKIKEEIAMTKLGQMIWDDALEKGIAQGREEGKAAESERYNHLILVLNQENRLDQIVKIASDREYRESLFRKYGI